MGILKTFTKRLLKLGRNYETYLVVVEALGKKIVTREKVLTSTKLFKQSGLGKR